ncbi:CPBP family intramembrane glutamic endopeptidase [Massilia sp. 9096]|uniref:CPBP family intramembrane glutamic endopeptidase n=1 Tax=Massilia sp. 9096 TaxID=1500894 RepID=UPI0018CD4FF9|nr:CPBP family intramembrane glutamic endopeptidase [Massilia sp. 9096]
MTQRPPRSNPASAVGPTPVRAHVRLSAQVLTCLVLCLLAGLILYFTRERPWRLFSQPLDPLWQLLIGQGLALVAAGASWLLYRRSADSEASMRTVASYARLDLRGHNPLWIALCAAVGEELLFRAALQPLLGVWIVSVLFLASHVPVYRLKRLDKPALVQAAGVFLASVALGTIYQYVGLLAAMLVHLWIDIVGLLVVRSVIQARD